VTQDQDSLSLLTLRQLRQKASQLRLPLYSRKTKAALIQEIIAYKKVETLEGKTTSFLSGLSSKKDSFDTKRVFETRVVFLPRDPEWAYVFWEINENDQKKAFSQGASRLSLRLADVTGLQDGSTHRQTLQELPVDSHATEWYLPIPMGDRDYRVELGYRTRDRWISLAFSTSARVPSLYPSDQILDQFVPFSLDTADTSSSKEATTTISSETASSGLHERLYQVATTHFRKTRVGSEEFQEHLSANYEFNESGSGIWASGRNESGLGGVPPRQRSLWLVADSELVLYGATDPSAKLTIGGEDVPLSNDGTFRLQVPFRDGLQKYPIEAKEFNGDQKRNITMQFERKTPQDNTHPSDQPKSEWF